MGTPIFDYNDEKTWDLFKEGRTKGIGYIKEVF